MTLPHEIPAERVSAAIQKMGYASLRPAQEACLSSIFAKKDTFAIIPTGGGKTLLAAIPALVLEVPVIVFSPLVALMADQVRALNERDVRAGCVSSGNPDVSNTLELQAWMDGETKVLLVSPERMQNPQFIAAMDVRNPGMVVIDEAHCMSQWASNFRPDYARVGDFVRKYNPTYLLAMTATATRQIVENVENILGRKLVRQYHYAPRENLHLKSQVVMDYDLQPAIIDYVRKHRDEPTIIYGATVEHVTDITASLALAGFDVACYHGQMENKVTKAVNQENFMKGRLNLMVATNAFGMGIDKPDIRCIVHADPPASLEALAQEVGRAGRDGKPAECMLFLSDAGIGRQELLCARSHPSGDAVVFAYNYFMNSMVNGESNVTIKQIEESYGDSSITSAVIYLVSRGVIERNAPKKIGMVRLPRHEVKLTPMQAKVYDAVTAMGVMNANGIYEVAVEAVAKHAGMDTAKVQSYLNKMAKDGKIEYTPPPRAKSTRILRPLNGDDIQFVNDARKDAYDKLNMVYKYAELPDEEKQQFMNDYFANILA